MNNRKESHRYAIFIVIATVLVSNGCRSHRDVETVTQQIHARIEGEVQTLDSVAHSRAVTDSAHVAVNTTFETKDSTVIRLDRDSAGRIVGIVAQRRTTGRGSNHIARQAQQQCTTATSSRHQERATATSDTDDTTSTEKKTQEVGASGGFLKDLITGVLLAAAALVGCLMVVRGINTKSSK